MKKYLFVLFFVILILIFIGKNNTYTVKITIKQPDLSASETDLYIAEKIKDELLQISNLKEIFIFSRDEICSIYCKIKPFSNKKFVIYEIEKKLNNAKNFLSKNAEINFEYNYDTKYQNLIIIYAKDVNYKVLKKYFDIFYDDLLDLKITSKILPMENDARCIYLNFKNSTLVKYDLTINEIKDILNSHNIIQNYSTQTIDENSYPVLVNGEYKNIEDIKNTTISFKDKNFSLKIKDIFEISETIKTPPDYLIKYKNHNALIFAVAKKPFYPDFLFDLKLKKLLKTKEDDFPKYIMLNKINLKSCDKIEIFLENNISLNKSECEAEKIQKEFQKNNINNALYFIGTDSPKTKNKDFFETTKNKITIVIPKNNFRTAKKILTELHYTQANNKDKFFETENYDLEKLYNIIENYKIKYKNQIYTQTTDKTGAISYDIDTYSLNDYDIQKEEVINSIIAYNDGYTAGSFYERGTKIPLIIKNSDNLTQIFIYSKRYKTLLPLNSFAKSELNKTYTVITRKNGKYYSKLHKSPS